MDPTLAKRRRWFQFSLRTLMIVVAIAAVASWGLWTGWPWWESYREQIRVETAIRQLKAGTKPSAAFKSLRKQPTATTIFRQSLDDKHRHVVAFPYVTERAIYCVYFVMPEETSLALGAPCMSLEAFRLPRMPRNYQPKAQYGRGLEMDYVMDFFSMRKGDRTNNPGFQYELIYSDPPANTKPH